MLNRLRNKFKSPTTTEADDLIRVAADFPRYTPHTFRYKNLALEVSDFISVAYQLKEYFDDQRMKFHSKNAKPVIIDCGANVGVSVLYFKSLFPQAKILAFEPDPKIFGYLQKNLLANKVADVTIEQKAIWTDDRGISFGSEGADGGSVFFPTNKNVVPSVSLKTILEKETSVTLLKMDIEGAEVEVIKNCDETLKKVQYLFVEYHSWINNPQELDELLSTMKRNGFRYYIHSIGHQATQPFMGIQQANGMDVQLDIYAINERFED
jgi:FkbM family methyltransferase